MRALFSLLPLCLIAACTTPVENSLDFKWLPLPRGEVSRIAFGSCSNQYLAQPIWTKLLDAKPDLFIYQGDIIYGDVAPPGTRLLDPSIDQIEKMRMDYAFVHTNPDFAAVRESIPVMAIWDDHDFGRNDGGADFGLKQESRELFFDFIDEPEESERRKSPGVYQAKIFGSPGRRVQVILLDLRSFRDPLVKSELTQTEAFAKNVIGRYAPTEDLSATLLGDEQWAWLEAQLRKPAEVRLINSSIQVVAGEKGAESWGNLPHERQRLYNLIESTGANGVVLLSGDVHFAEISRSDEGVYPLFDFTASPLAQYPTGSPGWEKAINSRRIKGPFIRDNFGLVEIRWDARPRATISLKLIAADGTRTFQYELPISWLRPY